VKGMTISNSLLGTTFFTLTGTHGCHVAVGVLWLSLMYVRSFKPAPGNPWADSWLSHNLLHAGTLLAALLLTLKIVISLVFTLKEAATGMEGLSHFASTQWLFVVLAGAAYWGLTYFARPRGAVQFDEHNAIDVESMGLYWHFVDIVWIVIFTAVYLLEYI
jgi:cytochrome o ubiquinol oxidase subunit III